MKYDQRTLAKAAIAALLSQTIFFLQALSPSNSKVITSGRPLSEAARLLEGIYAKPVTYEDPLLMWRGDIGWSSSGAGVNLHPKDRSFSLPVEFGEQKPPTLDLALVERILDAYHTQTDGPRFRVISSRWGLHIVPSQARNISGQWISIKPLLDSRINIEVESRTPYAHFAALCDAVTDSAGIEIKAAAPWLDQNFAPNGLIPPRIGTLTDEEKKQISFTWGVKGKIARDALISLIELSATTLTWDLRCSTEPSDRYCRLNLGPIQLPIANPYGLQLRKSLIWDRYKERPLTYLPRD